MPGPPRNFTVSNVTENGVRLTWQEPESFVEITSYQIEAKIIRTYSKFSITSPNWMYSNNTFQTELITLLPATKYNITLSTKSLSGNGALVHKVIETKIAGTSFCLYPTSSYVKTQLCYKNLFLVKDPDNLPPQPEIVSHEGSTIKIKMMSTINNNGPVTAYRIIVVDQDAKQGFEKDSVLSYEEAKKNGLSYYIAAELDPKVNLKFIYYFFLMYETSCSDGTKTLYYGMKNLVSI